MGNGSFEVLIFVVLVLPLLVVPRQRRRFRRRYRD